jgi:MoxR-like ATPase
MNRDYVPLFTPDPPSVRAAQDGTVGDRTSPAVYVFSEPIVLAINVALASGRPLLVRGASGSGKTSLARSVAARLGYRLIETVVTARTQARDLMWTVDVLRRLQDAQMKELAESWGAYVAPGPLWWAFDAESASAQRARSRTRSAPPAYASHADGTVVLIDEIDKAEPDVTNALLRPLGDLAFTVEETDERVEAKTPPCVVITTNEERDLPPAFLRRCVELNMPAADKPRLVQIGRAHFPRLDPEALEMAADLVLQAGRTREERDPNPAEYLDVLRACTQLGLTPQSASFRSLVGIVLGARAPDTASP